MVDTTPNQFTATALAFRSFFVDFPKIGEACGDPYEMGFLSGTIEAPY